MISLAKQLSAYVTAGSFAIRTPIQSCKSFGKLGLSSQSS